MISIIFYSLSVVVFIVGTILFIRGRRKPPKKPIKEILAEAERIAKEIEKGDPVSPSTTDILLSHILGEIGQVSGKVLDKSSTYSIASILVAMDLAIIGILFSVQFF